MKVVKVSYPYNYFQPDYDEMKPALEDVFYEVKGLLYSQFYKDQLLPIDVYDEIFGKDAEKNTDSVEEVLEQETEQVDEIIVEKVERKPRKKRQKSIIKK